jgi:hypothetical protein
VVIYLISLDLILTAADLILAQVRRTIHPGYDTTRIVSPTLPDGSIDYLKFLDDRRSEGVTPFNNAAVPFLQAIGRSALPSNQPPDGITDLLGMPHLPEQGDYLTGFDDYCKLHSTPLPPNFSPGDFPTTWPADITPAMRQWIESNAHPLDLLVQASLRTRFSIPWDGGNRPEMLEQVLIPHVDAFANVGSMLLRRAVIRLQSGDPTDCIRDLLAVHHLARLISQCPTLLERIEAQKKLESPALQVDRLVAASGKLSADQAKFLGAQLHAMGDLPPIADYLDNERIFVLDTTQALAAVPERFPDMLVDITNRPAGVPRFVFLFIPIPWESDMRALNHTYDGALAAMRQGPYSRRLAALQLWQQQVDSMKNASPVVRALSIAWSPDPYVSMLMLTVGNVEQKQDIAIMEKSLTEISLALAAYRADRGGYPAALDDLTPAYLPAIPPDLFCEKPPIYHPMPTGYLLYSVGPDMIDNGGGNDDIRVAVP